jgi:uncharacterized protein YggE
MNEPAEVLVSVRGEARRTVPPDSALIVGTITSAMGSTAAAARAAASALDGLTADLAAMGGVALAADTLRHPLTWSAHSAETHQEYAHDKKTGQNEPTGQVIATVALLVTVRSLDLLDAIGGRLSTHQSLQVRGVSWHVDWDNPGWRAVRAAAIQAAIAKGHDYAAALGGQLSTVQHIADPGLLASGDAQHWAASSGRTARFSGGGGDSAGTPSLDPVPQELTALIEARFTATGISLTQDTPPPS